MDLLQQPISLTLFGKEQVSTLTGGITTIAIQLFIISYLITKVNLVFKRGDTELAASTFSRFHNDDILEDTLQLVNN
jgi:hypothetical protein